MNELLEILSQRELTFMEIHKIIQVSKSLFAKEKGIETYLNLINSIRSYYKKYIENGTATEEEQENIISFMCLCLTINNPLINELQPKKINNK